MSGVAAVEATPDSVEPDGRSPGHRLRMLLPFAPLVALAIHHVVAVRAGLGIDPTVRGLAMVAGTQIFPGLLVWRVLRPRHGWWVEDVVMGLAVGACLAVGVQTVAGLLTARWVSLAAGPALGVALLLVPSSRSRIQRARTHPLPFVWGPLVGGISLLLIGPAQAFYRTVPLAWADGFRSIYVDMPFHQALIGQLAHRGPTEMPHVASEPLLYHWFSHAWMAQISAGGVAADAVLLRFVPPLISVAVVCAVAIAAVRLSGHVWAGPVAALLAVSAGDLGAVGGATEGLVVYHLSPSLGFAVLLVMALLVVLAIRWRGDAARGMVGLVALLGLTAVGAKGSALVVVLAGVGLAWGVAMCTGSSARGRIGVDLVVLSGALVVGFLALFESAGGLTLDPREALASASPVRAVTATFESAGPVPWASAAVLLAAAVLARGMGAIAMLTDHDLRRDPVLHLLVGIGLAGAGAVILLSHPGRSQVYFLRNAAPALAVASAFGMTRLSARLDQTVVRRAIGGGFLAGGIVWWILDRLPRWFASDDAGPALLATAGWVFVAAAAAIGAWLLARAAPPGARPATAVFVAGTVVLTVVTGPVVVTQITRKLPDAAQEVAPGAPRSVSADQIEAARWLRDNSEPRDLVMTNRHCDLRTGGRCGNRRFQVAAHTERRVLVEGWGYTPSWWAQTELPKTDREFPDPALLALNDAFLQSPTAERARAIRSYGVRWIYVDKVVAYSASLGEFATPRFESEWAWVLELAPER